MYERQHKYKLGFARPEVRIRKDDNEKIKKYLQEKGYKSINDYINTLIYIDMQYNIILNKEEITKKYPVEE